MLAIVYRCRPSKTKEIMQWAREHASGAVWVPTTTRIRRLPRSRKRVLCTRLVLPGYLFVRQERVPELAPIFHRMEATPVICPTGRPMVCPVAELFVFQEEVLRLTSAETVTTTPEEQPPVPIWAPGTPVEVATDHRLLAGVSGVVVSQSDEEVTVETPGFWGRLKISAFLLRKPEL